VCTTYDLIISQVGILLKKLIKCYIWSIAFYGAEIGQVGWQIGNPWNVFEHGTGEGRRRSVGPIV